MTDGDSYNDLLLFWAAIDEAHGETQPAQTLEYLTKYSMGLLTVNDSQRLEQTLLSNHAVRLRLREVVGAVRNLNAQPGTQTSLSNPFQHEVSRLWRKLRSDGQKPPDKKPQTPITIGRDEDLLSIQQMLEHLSTGPVVITGPGGIGKTRLLRQVEENTKAQFPGGIHYIDCAPLSSVEDFYSSVLWCLHGEPERQFRQAVVRRVGKDKVLLLLDRLDDLASLGEEIQWLLTNLPSLRILFTSRTGLGMPGERGYSLEPLNLANQGTAEKLFIELARNVVEGFKTTAANLKLIRELCHLSMGVPLSIALTAGALREQTLDTLVSELKQPISQLASKDPGHLANAVHHSLLLLAEADRNLLQQLAVFARGFSYEDAYSITREPDESLSKTLGHLQRCGVLEASVLDNGAATYLAHESVREAPSALSDHQKRITEERYVTLILTKATDVGMLMQEGHWVSGIQSLLNYNADFRKAIKRCLSEADQPRIRQFAESLARTYFELGFLSDFESLSDAAISLSDAGISIRMLGLKGALASLRSGDALCTQLWEQRLELCLENGNLVDAADTLNDLASQAVDLEDLDRAEQLTARAEKLATEAEAWEILASSYVVRIRVALAKERLAECRDWTEKVVELLPRCQDKMLLPFVYQGLSIAYDRLNDQESVLRVLKQLLALSAEGHRSVHVARTLAKLAPLYEARGEIETAVRCYTSALSVLNEYSRDRSRLESELEALCQRHPTRSKAMLREARSMAWTDFVASIL